MFIIAKLVNFLLNPALYIVVFLLMAWCTRNPWRRKRWLGAGLAIFLFFSNPLIIQRLVQAYQWPPQPMIKGESYEAGVLLGGLMGFDPDLKDAYFTGSSDRFIQTLKLYKQGHIRKIIVSGGNASIGGGIYREADYLAANLRAMGVPAQDILSDREARNTVENAGYTHRITDSLHLASKIVVITSAFHMPRAIKIFEKEGIQVRPFPADFIAPPLHKSFNIYHLIPSGMAMNTWNLLLKEWVGRMAISLQSQ